MATIEEALATAVRHHQAGDARQAETIYRQILQVAPGQPNALHMLGILAYQAGNFPAAVELVRGAVASFPADHRFHTTLGTVYLALQQLDAAVASFRQAASLAPTVAEGHYNLANALKKQGQLDAAAAAYQQALVLKPNLVPAHNNLGNVLLEQNKLEEAAASFRHALRVDPAHTLAHNNLGNALRKLGRLEEAAACFQQALLLKPDYDQAHTNLGNVYQDQGKFDLAMAYFHHALRCNPQSAAANLSLGVVLRGRGHLDEALTYCRRAIELQPQDGEGHFQLGLVLQQQGDVDGAIAAYRQAAQLRPKHADTWNRLATLLQSQDRLDEAVANFRQALSFLPDCLEFHNNLGNTLCVQKKWEEAAACYRQVLRLQPDNVMAYYNLGRAFADQEKTEQATACYHLALSFDPVMTIATVDVAGALSDHGANVEMAIATMERELGLDLPDRLRVMVATRLPAIYQSMADLEAWRERLTREVGLLRARGVSVDLTEEAPKTMFYLAYQGRNDRDLQREIARLFRLRDQTGGPSFVASDPSNRKIKVGFLSAYFQPHTISHLNRGLVAQLSRQDFAVTVLSVGRFNDPYADFFREHADHYLEVPKHLPSARRLIAEQNLDVLFYTDIGMDSVTYALAFSRLAPVQCVTWGHPVTTGIDTIDYFISSADLESGTAKDHYTETLIRPKTVPIYYYRDELPPQLMGKEDFGLADEDHVYTCAQSLFKFHPEFDEVLGGILRGDAQGKIVLIEGKYPVWEQLLRRRFATTLPDVVDRIHVVPNQRRRHFLNLLALSDVLLDTLHFGGGNTTYESLMVGTPVVTLPTQFLRGRISYALYKQMQVLDCVASSPREYIDIALRLGTDPDYRLSISQKILAANAVLFENSAGIRELEEFFRQAVTASYHNGGIATS